MTADEIFLAQRALDLEKKRLEKMVQARRIVTFDESLSHRPNPLCGKIRADKIDPNKKVPNLPRYNGSGCPLEHIIHYEGPMEAQGHNQNVMAALFQTTLFGTALDWYTGLDSGSILSFGQLAREFSHHFGNFKKRKKPYSCLAEVIQGPEESFSAFIHRFDAVAITVGELPLTLRLDYLYSNTNHRRFADELSDCPPKTMSELSALKEKHMAGDDYCIGQNSLLSAGLAH